MVKMTGTTCYTFSAVSRYNRFCFRKAASGHDLRDAPSDDDGDQDAIATIDGMASFLSKAIAKVPHDYIVWFRDQVTYCSCSLVHF